MTLDPPSERLLEIVEGEGASAFLAEVHRLGARVEALRERGMRRAVVVETVEAWNEVELVGFMAVLLRRVREGWAGGRAVMQELALEPAVFDELPYERIAAAYALARQTGQESVARMFLSPALHLNPTIDEAFTGNEHLDLPVGIRRAAARTSDRFKLDRLLHDRDARVIRVLLDNPRLVEHDVVKIAAMRPTRPEVLAVVARHVRWSSRYSVRKALAANPYTPESVARRLLPTLMRQDLRLVLQAGVLSADLRQDAQRLLDASAAPTRGDEE